MEKYDGVYYITQKGVAAEKSLAIQVVVHKSEPLLKAMDKKPLDEATADKVAEAVKAIGNKENVGKLGYWLKALTQENLEKIVHIMGGDMATESAILKILEASVFSDRLKAKGLQEGLQKGRQEGLQKGLQEGRQKGALEVIELLEKGYSLADAKRKLQLA